MERVRITHLDGKLPNLALMSISRHHRDRGDEIVFTHRPERGLFEPAVYDRVYGSAIFSGSKDLVARLKRAFPGAVVGGTHDVTRNGTVEDVLGPVTGLDYSIYPDFTASIGMMSRGCRFKCGWCVVPRKEGGARRSMGVREVWRGGSHPKHIHALDNDVFGLPKPEWRSLFAEIRDGGFKVSFTQGINIRAIGEEEAEALGSIRPSDDRFTRTRLYTAWDSRKDESRFLRGVETLERHGIGPQFLVVYMLVGYAKDETWASVMHRFETMDRLKARPFPMVWGPRERGLPLGGADARLENRTLGEFQRWANRFSRFIPFTDYDASAKGRLQPRDPDLFDALP